MKNNSRQRKLYFDVLKAIAIIAVVLFHLGVCGNGYLGVDVFLVVAGYFTSLSISGRKASWGGYYLFVFSRLFRLWPLLLVAGLVCLILGWWLMLPDDYENLAESVVATNFFGNNILQAITTKNYWDVVNEYKPLMHTWYVGLLMQYYVIFAILIFAVSKYADNKSNNKVLTGFVGSIAFFSLIAYLCLGSTAEKFYYLPFRLFEFCMGSLVFYIQDNFHVKSCNSGAISVAFVTSYFILFALLFLDISLSSSILLISTVLLSGLLLFLMPHVQVSSNSLFSNKYLAIIGASSLSLYVWHQIVFAFTRYSFTGDLFSAKVLLAMLLVIIILSAVSYRYIEKLTENKSSWTITLILLLATTSGALYVYKEAGVVRDVPELEVFRSHSHRGMWKEYVDKGYKYDKNFPNSNKIKILVIGNSFGRDMVNIIEESEIANKVDVSYSETKSYNDKKKRFQKADIVFLSTLGLNNELIEEVSQLCTNPKTKFYIVGEKNFGESNGQIYRQRYKKDYHNLTISMENGYAERNRYYKSLHPNNYIDMISIAQQPDGKVKVFTDDGKFISQDCRHLTRAGAKWYANKIDWKAFID